MGLSSSKTIKFLSILVVTASLAGCNSAGTDTSTAPEATGPWTKTGNSYSIFSTYERPKGVSEDTFVVTVDKDGLVTAAKAIVPEDGGKHAEGLVRFNEALSPVIVGKELSEIGDFDTLGEYSLTTAAFNEALGKLQVQVKSNS